MIHINLLPVRQIKQRLRIRNEVAMYLLVVGFTIILLSTITINQFMTISSLTSENKELATKKASYQPILNEIESLKKSKHEQETKLEVIKKLKTGSLISVHILDEIAKIFPHNRLWLTSLSQTSDNINIKGIALDNATIAQFMQRINNSTWFSNSVLSQAQQISISDAKLKSYSLTFNITPPKVSETK